MAVTRSGWPAIIAHADMDAFYAAVEQLDHPELRGRPVLVGGKSDRGVVLTASYEARPFGVGSAVPMARARRLCPQAIIVPPRFDRYQEVSATIMKVFADFSPDVEAISLDEAFLDMSGAELLFGDPATIGQKLKRAVREATGGLTASVGISTTKYVAKVASGHRKPDGLTVVAPGEAKAWLAPQPVSRLWGVGPKTEARLLALGLRNISDVADADPLWLERNLGSAGRHFQALSRAEDPRVVATGRASKSIGSERTLARDVADTDELKRYLRRSAEEIARRLRRKTLVAAGVRVKLKTSRFQILTRQHHLEPVADTAETLYREGARLLDTFDHPGPFRLVGMAAYDLQRRPQDEQLELFAHPGRQRSLETAVDALTERFGRGVLRRAEDLGRGAPLRQTPNLDFLDTDGEDSG